MNILVIGCGKTGSRLASILSENGHAVSVVSNDCDDFLRLSDEYDGLTVCGIPIDQDILVSAGIEGCDALAAVTEDDNMNIMVSQIAREVFSVPKILTRIFDPTREDVYSQLGLSTICPINITVEAMSSSIVEDEQSEFLTFGTSTTKFRKIKIEKNFIGCKLKDYKPKDTNEEVFGVVLSNHRVILVKNNEDKVLGEDEKIILYKIVD